MPRAKRPSMPAPTPSADLLFEAIERERSQLRRAASLMAVMHFALTYSDWVEEQVGPINFADLADLAYGLTYSAMDNLDQVRLKKMAAAQAPTSATD